MAGELNFRCEFHVGNLLQEGPFQRAKTESFDTVSCQLAIHYCIMCESAARDLLMRISGRLTPGGYFIGSTADTDSIVAGLQKGHLVTKGGKDLFEFGNRIYSVSFERNAIDMIDEAAWVSGVVNFNAMRLEEKLLATWGIPYHFSLIEHIDATEYVVPWSAFCRVAQECELELILKQNFAEFYSERGLQSNFLKTRAGQQISVQEEEACQMYAVFVFRKRLPNDPSSGYRVAPRAPADGGSSRPHRVRREGPSALGQRPAGYGREQALKGKKKAFTADSFSSEKALGAAIDLTSRPAAGSSEVMQVDHGELRAGRQSTSLEGIPWERRAPTCAAPPPLGALPLHGAPSSTPALSQNFGAMPRMSQNLHPMSQGEAVPPMSQGVFPMSQGVFPMSQGVF
eukprot:Polyplicarium_translucidae@DN4639_c0_g1_i1.p1